MPFAGGVHEFLKEIAGNLVTLKCPLRMPLHSKNVVSWDSPFNRLDHAVFSAMRHRAQAITHNIGRLMMAGIYRHSGSILSVKNFFGQQRIRSHSHLVRNFNLGADAVVYL